MKGLPALAKQTRPCIHIGKIKGDGQQMPQLIRRGGEQMASKGQGSVV